MKKFATTMTLMALILALNIPSAWAEPSEVVTGVYDALLATGSDYSKAKAINTEYFPDTEYEEKLDGDGFTIAVRGNEYANGFWRFTRNGDALTATISNEGMESVMVIYVVKAVADYLGMNGSLAMGYVNGLSMLELKEIPHNPGSRLAGDFQPSAACKFLDLPPGLASPFSLKTVHWTVFRALEPSKPAKFASHG